MIEADRLISPVPLCRKMWQIAPFALNYWKVCWSAAGSFTDGDFHQSSEMRGDALDHLLIFGPPGLGKTRLLTLSPMKWALIYARLLVRAGKGGGSGSDAH